VLSDTVRLIDQLRNEGRTVLVHCVARPIRIPTAAALCDARKQGISGETALRDITSALPDAYPNSDFRGALRLRSSSDGVAVAVVFLWGYKCALHPCPLPALIG
jgi:hypothetical protein